MAKSQVYQRGAGGGVDFNMTPMIDVTFQLILFFILVGQVASEELAKMELPQPDTSQAIKQEEAVTPNHAVVNVVLDAEAESAPPGSLKAGMVGFYQVGTTQVQPDVDARKRLTSLIEARKAELTESQRESFYVEIRSDKRIHFEQVVPVLLAASDAKVQKMNITALLDLGSE